MDKDRVGNARPVNDLEYMWRCPELTERFKKSIDEVALLSDSQLISPRIQGKPPTLTGNRSEIKQYGRSPLRNSPLQRFEIQLPDMTS